VGPGEAYDSPTECEAVMAPKPKRAALYVRVSTDGQTVDNQRLALEVVCEQRGWQVSRKISLSQIVRSVSTSGGRDYPRRR
jgi:DNA invertase Pin-like site-specific DNA recombinase